MSYSWHWHESTAVEIPRAVDHSVHTHCSVSKQAVWTVHERLPFEYFTYSFDMRVFTLCLRRVIGVTILSLCSARFHADCLEWGTRGVAGLNVCFTMYLSLLLIKWQCKIINETTVLHTVINKKHMGLSGGLLPAGWRKRSPPTGGCLNVLGWWGVFRNEYDWSAVVLWSIMSTLWWHVVSGRHVGMLEWHRWSNTHSALSNKREHALYSHDRWLIYHLSLSRG